MQIHYLNNAATSYPKPAAVLEAVSRNLESPPSEPGRVGGNGDDVLRTCRAELAQLFGVMQPERIVLLPSATYAINQVLWGLLGAGDHVVTTTFEHNSVLRPLAHLARERGVETTHVEPLADTTVDAGSITAAIRPQTRLVAVSHAGNVTGAVQPVAEIAAAVAQRGVALLIDAAQSAGALNIDHGRLPGRVFIVFAGHKGLLGPTGVGGLVLPDEDLPQTIAGGTGIRSESLTHPEELPLRHEAGTPNLPGIAGLAAGAAWVRLRGVTTEGEHRNSLVQQCRERLRRVPGLTLLPLPGDDGRAGIVSFTAEGRSPDELAFALRQGFQIETRAGLHCAPLSHRGLGTWPQGTVRVSFGAFNRAEQVAALADALYGLMRR